MINREEGEKICLTGTGKGGLMDWDLKASARDLSECGREYGGPLAALAGSRSLARLRGVGRFSVDLGLGRLGDLGDDSLDKLTVPRVQQIVSSPLNSSRRTNLLNGNQNVVCLVEGCKSDLSKCRQYYRRHRVCEHHSKAPIVIFGGKVQRFCQKCSRFHSLIEFDEVKRSCRKRLDSHNRRRRKPHPYSLNMGSGCFLSNYKGAGMSQFSGSQACATTAANSLPWLCATEDQQKLQIIDQHITFSNSSAFIWNRGDRQFPILQANNLEKSNEAAPEISIWLQDVSTTASSENGRGHRKMLSSLLTESDDSKSALYLLSKHQPQTLLSLLSTPNHCLPSYSCSGGMKDKAVDSAGVPDINTTNDGCNDIFHLMMPDGLLKNGAS